MMRLIGSEFLFWAGLHIARDRMLATVVATPLSVVVAANLAEQARVKAMLESILPVSASAAGLRAAAAAGKATMPTDLTCVAVPTLNVSARNDGYGTSVNAEYMHEEIAGAHFLGVRTVGHAGVGHNDAVMAAIAELVLFAQLARMQ